MTTQQMPSVERMHHTITLRHNRTGMDFEISGPLFGEDTHERWYGSVKECEEAIERAYKAQRSIDKVELHLPIYNSDGEPGTITGIHAGNGSVTGSNLGVADNVYPRIDWVKDRIKRRAALRVELSVIDYQLREVSVRRKWHSFGRPDPARVPVLLGSMQKEWNEANELAKRGPPSGDNA